jgi:CspA family cold shock protein
MIRLFAILSFLLLSVPAVHADELGTIRWFDSKAGYCFITPQGGEERDEVFMHFSAIQGDDKSLEAGQKVIFKKDEKNHKQAKWVKPIHDDKVAQN